jgi:hypothetical protein
VASRLTGVRAAAGIFVSVAVALAAFSLADSSLAGAPNHAGLVVTFPDHTETFSVEFSEQEIDGAELLRRSGLVVTFSGFGGLGAGVCAIEQVGCFNPGDCFCQCKSGTCKYWVYFRAENGNWVRSAVGASTRKLRDGDVDGWAWGSGTPPAGIQTPSPCPTPTETAQSVPSEPSAGDAGAGAQAPNAQPQFGGGAVLAGTPAAAASTPATPGVPAASPQQAGPTPGSSPQVRRIGESEPGVEQRANESDSDASRTNLIVFSAVATLMLGATGVAILRRKRRG